MPLQERLNIAVFIDFDNIEIGVKTTLGEGFDIGTILEALKERGEVVTKIAYADWTRAGEYSRMLTQHAIRLVQRNLTPGGDKNGADINLALDALEMAFTHPHINSYVIVGGDSDFLSLVEKLKQYDKKVFVVGGRAFTSVILQRNCHEFIAYENLVRKPSARGGRAPAAVSTAPIAQAFPIVRRALKILADREVSPQTGLLKSTLLQLDSTFSERNYGASSFLDFVEKLSKAGLVQIKQAGRSVMVELREDVKTVEDAEVAEGAEARPAAAGEATRAASVQPREQPQQIGDNDAGVKAAGEIIAAATNARWPMYLRNLKQILRAGGFDERQYGFGGLMDLLRACQKQGLIRLERDRRGGLRVFQGQALSRGGAPAAPPVAEIAEIIDAADSAQGGPFDFAQGGRAGETIPEIPAELVVDVDAEVEPQPPVVVDTTAELLGRVKAKRARARSAGEGARKTPTKKTAAPSRRASRTKREPPEAANGRR